MVQRLFVNAFRTLPLFFNMLMIAETANTGLPPLQFLHRTAIRILIDVKYDD
jgi:hypothetical protein